MTDNQSKSINPTQSGGIAAAVPTGCLVSGQKHVFSCIINGLMLKVTISSESL
jgi:hypothetical protein